MVEWPNFKNGFAVLAFLAVKEKFFNFTDVHLKSVNSNFTLAVHSPKFNHAKTHFLSHHNVS